MRVSASIQIYRNRSRHGFSRGRNNATMGHEITQRKEGHNVATGMTKTPLVGKMGEGMTQTAQVRTRGEKLELTNKQSAAFLDLLAETAVKETKKNGVFVIP